MRQDPENRVKDTVQMLAHVLCQKSQNETAVFLHQGVLPPVAPIGVRIIQMLGAIQFENPFRMFLHGINDPVPEGRRARDGG